MEKNLMVIESSNVLTMSSLEIAELTGKRHDHVVRDIKAMFEQLGDEGGLLTAQDTYTHQHAESVRNSLSYFHSSV